MGRAEQQLRRLRERLDQVPWEGDLEPWAQEVLGIARSLARADALLEPVLTALADRLSAGPAGDGVMDLARDVVDAAVEYAAGREAPDRDALLAAAEDRLARGASPDAPTLPTPEPVSDAGLPPGFVGDLPPESTLNDAALLLVQLEPHDRYGIASLVEILDRLAGDEKDERAERLLRRAVRVLTEGEPSQETLGTVGELLESVSEGTVEPVEAIRAERAEPGSDGGREPASGPGPDTAVPTAAGPARSPEAAWRPGPDTDADLMREFLLESTDLMRSAEKALLELESDPSDGEAINVVFRAFHTIKGTSAFLGIDAAAELCHHAESLFSKVRDAAVAFSPGIADLSLASVDLLTRILDEVGVALEGAEPMVVDGLGALAQRLQRASAGQEENGPGAGAAAVPAAGAPALKVAAAREGGPSPRDRETSVRVRTDRLDRLVDMVGELVIAQSMIAQDAVVQDGAQHGLAKKVAHGGKIVRELQDLSMALRMVPLKSTFSKLQRLVRDLARKSGKQVRLLTEGEETEIDRTMVDVLGDPLVHMIRNAMDHGLEPAGDREAAGKDVTGTLWLRAYHGGGNVVVELEDDGRGMNRERIVAKALERGLIRTGDGLTDSEVWNLVFEPGFSTAEAITDVSGRGVGMDVVRRNIETLRGRIEVESTWGAGTKVTLRLPLTLAITEGMLMRVGPERYILPTLSIERNIRPTREMLSTVTGRGEMLMLRDELLPIVRLHELFGVEASRESVEEGLLVVVGAAERRCALLVDELLGQHQVVVKSLGDGLGKVKGVTGGAVLGDGTVGLILDAGELVAMARNGASATQAA